MVINYAVGQFTLGVYNQRGPGYRRQRILCYGLDSKHNFICVHDDNGLMKQTAYLKIQ